MILSQQYLINKITELSKLVLNLWQQEPDWNEIEWYELVLSSVKKYYKDNYKTKQEYNNE